jgi:hypothetical protein
LNGSWGFQTFLFVMAFCFAICFIAGYQTRVATLGCWIMLVSFHVRAPLILNAGDTLLHCWFFWSLFLPLGRVLSLDAVRRRTVPVDSPTHCSVASAALILQICLMYWFSALSKCNAYWLEASALNYILAFDMYCRPAAHWVGQFPLVTRVLSWGTLLLEFVGPVVMLIPYRTALLRVVVIALLALFHVGIELTLKVELLSFICLSGLVALLPGIVWERIGWKLPAIAPDAPRRGPRWARIGTAVVCLPLLLTVVIWNVIVTTSTSLPPLATRAMGCLLNVVMLSQKWDMFANPPTEDVWFVYRARLKNGQLVDILRGGAPVDFERPSAADPVFPGHRWRKMHHHLLREDLKRYRNAVADYLCRRWNRTHSEAEQIVVLDVFCLGEQLGTGRDAGRRSRSRFARSVWGTEVETGNFAEALEALQKEGD